MCIYFNICVCVSVGVCMNVGIVVSLQCFDHVLPPRILKG